MTWQDLIGAQIGGQYTLRTLLYAGSHQSEFLGTASDTGEKAVSVALLEPDPGQAEEELAAIHKAKQLRHFNLLQILDAGESVLHGALVIYIVTEAAESTLAAALEAGSLADPSALLEDVVTALEWLHGQNLVYRNLAPDTVVRAGNRWKLADLSQLHPAGQFDPIPAAGRTAPPEAKAGSITPAWDAWSLGVLLRDAIRGEGGVLPAPFDTIMRRCLDPDPARRLSLPAIRKMLAPEPVLAPLVPPAPQPHMFEDAPPHPSRRPWLFAMGAALLILCLLLFAFVRRGRNAASPSKAVPVSHPVAPPVSRPVTAAAPAVVPPPKRATAKPAPTRPAPTRPAPAKPAPAQPAGLADFFSDGLNGHPTASGEKFSNQSMTAASREFPIGTRLRVTNLQNGRHVIVRVNDRGPHRRGFIISVTRRAAEQLGFVKDGSAQVRLEIAK